MKYGRVFVVAAALAALLGAAPAAQAQSSVMDYRWSFDVGLGWDVGVSGKINSGAIGTLNNQVTVIVPNSYGKAYGTGFHLRFGGGYLVDEVTEVRAVFTYQDLGADLVPMGDLGQTNLYGVYDPYRSFGLDVGFRRYFDASPAVRPYLEATAGLGFISEIDVVLAAPAANMTERATDFYDRTAAVTFGGNAGALWQVSNYVGVYAQIGLRWTTGMAAIDDLAGTGLETINDDSSRWTMPIVVGMRVRF